MDYRDKYIGVFTTKPGALVIRSSGLKVETHLWKDPHRFASYEWCSADNEFLYLYYDCDEFESNSVGGVTFIIKVNEAILEENVPNPWESSEEPRYGLPFK